MPGASYTYPAEVIGPVDGSRVVRFVLNTAAPDRHGTVFLPSGCRAENYLKNPVFTWGHAELKEDAEPDDVIGRSLRVGFNAAEGAIVIDVEFEDERNPRAQRCFEKVQSGYLRSVSITAERLKERADGELVYVDDWELWAASLCIVGSNPEALALRYLLSTGRESSMNMSEVYSALGLEDGATYEECLQALINMLAGDDPEKQKIALAVMSMKALGGGMPAATPDAAAAAAPAAGSDPAAMAAGMEDDKMNMRAMDDDKMAMRAVISAQATAIKTLQAAARSAPAEEPDPEKWADAKIKEGAWAPGQRDELVKLRKERPQVAARAVALMKESGVTFAPHRERLGALGSGLRAAARSAPNFGQDGERLGSGSAKAKADAKAIREKANGRLKRELGTVVKGEE